MITKIGLAAGDIWHFLDKQPGFATRFSTLVAKLGLPRDVLLMSVGWLAREGHIILKPLGDDYDVALRKPS